MARESGEPRRPRLPEPGWLPDPAELGIERYWDGARWTPRTRDRTTKREIVSPSSGERHGLRGGGTPVNSWTARKGRKGRARAARVRTTAAWLLALSTVTVLVAGVNGMLPSWVPWPQSASGAIPEGPEVAYPVFGSNDLVLYLATSMIAQDDSVDVSFLNSFDPASKDRLEDALREASAQNPYVFVRGWKVASEGTRTTVRPVYVYSDDEAQARREATATAVASLVTSSGASATLPEATRVELLHDAIAKTAKYDFDAANAIAANQESATVDSSQEAYGILVSRTAVCTGYAEAFKLAASAVGLESVVVTGDVVDGPTIGPHAWNRVRVDGTWRVVDVTWDDLDGANGEVSHDFLLVPDGHPLLASRVADSDWIVADAIVEYS